MSQEPHNNQLEPTPQKEDSRSRSVVIYILILFIAAFLLMALSSLMHQRSNAEALGALQSSVSSMQELQTAQERIITLQEELDETKDALGAAEDDLEDLRDTYETDMQEAQRRLDDRQTALDAMTNLYFLEHAFQVEDYDSCQRIIQGMEEQGLADALLIEGAAEGNPSEGLVFPSFWSQPRHRYDHIKADVEARLAENAAP